MRRFSAVAILAAAAALIVAAFLNRGPRETVRRDGPGPGPTASAAPTADPAGSPAGAVIVTTTDGTGPLGGVSLRIVNEARHAELEGRTDAEGLCTFPRVPAGDATL